MSKSSWIRPGTRLAIYLRDDLTCTWCGADYASGATLTLDHLVRREDGGANDPSNIATACWMCNSIPAGRPQDTRSIRLARARVARSRSRDGLLPAFREVARLFECYGDPEWVTELKRRGRECRGKGKEIQMGIGVGKVVSLFGGQPYDVYIGRRGKGEIGYFGSPIIVHRTCQICEEFHGTRGSTLECFERWARERGEQDPEYRQRVADLHRKVLACFCLPGSPCHGNVLMALALEWSGGEENRNDEGIPF